jgi:prophage maintenance system killer protein
MQPMATFGGQFLHDDLFLMAAAYLFHIVKNHAFWTVTNAQVFLPPWSF